MKKNQQILVLNTFAIIMVCIGHSFTAVESYYGHKWIYSFHIMPLFMAEFNLQMQQNSD